MKQILAFLCFISSFFAFGQAKSGDLEGIVKKKYFTERIKSESPVIDGILNDLVWETVEWGGDFIQNQPTEGIAPTEQTRFKILYDEKNLYIAYFCEDSAQDSIVERMSRRDQFPGDWVEINIDSYHDLRTAFSFTISASGVRGDELISNNGNNWDGSWNPIWHAKTSIDEKGWYAEVVIPFSQLRFKNTDNNVWGIQFTRRFFRKEERSIWQNIPRNAGVWVSGFGELHGIRDIKAKRQFEAAPYLVTSVEKYKKEEGNPFATGLDSKLSAGIDGKIAVTSDLIVDYTINPDFGQVEADPSQVRIDGFQNFFREQRPFFIESRNIFDYQVTGSEAGGDYDSDILFYSRRIGSSPHGYPKLGSNQFAKIPSATPIIGATKFSGKTKGLSIGILESVTREVYAKIDANGTEDKQLIEPLTNYFVGRIQQDFNEGQTVLGGIFTAVNRNSDLNSLVHKSAYTGGLDVQHFWNERKWYVKSNFVMSSVQGTKEKILDTQTSFEHLFQRPNASELSIDSSLTALQGTGGTFKIGKIGGTPGKYGQVFKFESGFTYRSPGLELNDIGFMLASNEIYQFNWAGFQFTQPTKLFRQRRINFNNYSQFDFSGQFLTTWFNTNMHGTFNNNWSVGTGVNFTPFFISNNALRGGSSLRANGNVNNWIYINSDERKKLTYSVNIFHLYGLENTSYAGNYELGIGIQALDALSFYIASGYNNSTKKQDQYAATAYFNGEERTIVSKLEQQTLNFTLRMSYNITPDLTIQYYGQPFITRPIFSDFAYVVDPLNKDFESRFQKFSASDITKIDDVYQVDENGDGSVDYSFGSPDFNFVQFRSNLVARWEYKAGSELYLVWSQNNSPDAFGDLNTPIFNSLWNNSFNKEGKRNILLLKMTYRFY